MRKQYHARHTPHGRYIWDVHRLVAQAALLPVREIPLAQIRELDEPYWFERDVDVPTCRAIADHARLIAETDLHYPILLCAEGRVMDGMHRVAKAYLEGRSTLPALQFAETPPPDYIDVPLDDLPYDEAP